VFIQNIETGERRRLRAEAREPSWFMDGERLAVQSFEFEGSDDSKLAIIDTNGNMLIRLTDDEVMVGEIDVSHDEKWIVTTLDYEGVPSMMYLVSTKGGEVSCLSSVGATYPSFSPSGEWIAFTNISDDGRIWLIRPDGTDLQQMTGPRW